MPVVEISLMLLFVEVFDKPCEVAKERDLRPEDLGPGVSVGVGRPPIALTRLPDARARGLKFKLAGRGRDGDGLVIATVSGVGVIGSGAATAMEETTMACSRTSLTTTSSSSSSSSTSV